MRTGKLNHARREMHIARMNENNMRNQLRARVDHLKTENAELRRLIKEVAIPALTECDEAMDYMSEYDILLMLPDHVKTGLATLQEAVK